MALMAYGVGPGDAIFTSPFTFIATAEVISLLGAVPVFVDIDPETYNLSPQALAEAIAALDQGRAARHPLPRMEGDSLRLPVPLKPRGIIAVDLYGLPATMMKSMRLRANTTCLSSRMARSPLEERSGEREWALERSGMHLFLSRETAGCYGDGGMCFHADDGLAELMRSISLHGKGHHKYENVRIGVNGRLDTLQAAISWPNRDFPGGGGAATGCARSYTDLIASGSSVVTPACQRVEISLGSIHRPGEGCRAPGGAAKPPGPGCIPTAIYYPKPLHLQHAFAPLGYRTGDFPVSEDYATASSACPCILT